MSNQRQIGVTFTPENEHLRLWAIEQANMPPRPMPVNWFVIQAIECYRRFDGNLQTANTAHAIAALFNGSLTEAQAAKTAYDLLIKECGSIEWAIAHFKLQEMDNE